MALADGRSAKKESNLPLPGSMIRAPRRGGAIEGADLYRRCESAAIPFATKPSVCFQDCRAPAAFMP